MLVAVLAPAGAVLYTERLWRSELERHVRSAAALHAESVAARIRLIVSGHRQLPQTVAQAESIRNGEWHRCETFLQRVGRLLSET